MGVGWKSTFAELFVSALGDHTLPTGLERRSFGASVQAVEVGLGLEFWLGLKLALGLNRGLAAEFLMVISLLEIVSTAEKSKWRNKAKSFCN